MIAVAISYEQFVRRRMDPLICRPVQIRRVGITLALVAATDLHDELAVLRKLQQLVIGDRPHSGQAIRRTIDSAQPDEALVINMEAVFSFWPFKAIARTAPGFDEIACRIEHDDRRCSHPSLIGRERPRTVQDPYVVLRIGGNAGWIAEFPFCRHRRPRAVYLEYRQAAALRRGRLGGQRRARKPCRYHASGHNQCDENRTTQVLALHGCLPFLTVRA